MRTTMQTMYRQVLNNLDNLTSDIRNLNNQISSTQQMSKLSDNPVHLVSALSLRSSLAELNQYQENLLYGEKMMSASESTLTQIKELTMRAKVLALQANNGSIVQSQRLNTAVEVHNLFEHAITLANTQINGKYIFAGYRTTGYNSIEPAPFIEDLVDGYRVNGNNLATMDTMLTGTVTNTTIDANTLQINGENVGAINTGAVTNGLNMEKAFNARTEINLAGAAGAPDVIITATLTTLYADASASTPVGGSITGGEIEFELNDVSVTVTIAIGDDETAIATKTMEAINGVKHLTGVEAVVGVGGVGGNGGVDNSVVFRNILAGDESTISVTLNSNTSDANPGFVTFGKAADIDHNTGTISIQSNKSFTITSPGTANDSILDQLGLGGGNKGFADVDDDGELIYGYHMTDADLVINSYSVGSSADDTISDVYADTSAAAKAAAINAVSTNTGVTAVVTPVYRQAMGAVGASPIDNNIGPGDLWINGEDIFDFDTTIQALDSDNALIDAINAKTGTTGIKASRNGGTLILSAEDGRNLHIQTSALGESISHLNSSAPTVSPQDKVYFGSLQLKSERTFLLETTLTTGVVEYEPGLATIGLDGGALSTGEPSDTADDGKLSVISIAKQDNNVRYTGDRINDLKIKIGKTSTLTVAKNGKETIIDTGVFTVLKTLEDSLRNLNFTTVTGIHQATDTTETLDSENTGLPNEDDFLNGSFTITVTDHAFYPPKDFGMTISIDTSVDTLEGIATKMNGIPGMKSWWDSDGYLHLETIDQDRYSYTANDTSNFLEVTGITQYETQVQGLGNSIADLDQLMDDLTGRISDFGALTNRTMIQRRIYDSLELSTAENLSEQQDTDLIKALMQLKNKETAYQAALAATARSLQISLVDFL